MQRVVKLVVFVSVVMVFRSAEPALAQYVTGPDGQYAGAVKGAPPQKKMDEPQKFYGVEPHLGYLWGHTTYQVYEGSDPAHSELEFPMNSAVAGIGVSFGRRDVWDIGLSIATNITRDTGKMKDSDWGGYGYPPSVKTDYSESDTMMQALLMDLKGTYWFLRKPNALLGVTGGYRYQILDFEIRNLKQWSPVGAYPVDYVSGKILTYEMNHKIPYAGLSVAVRPSTTFSLNFLGSAGWTYARDEDDHILRGLRSTAEMDGPFYLLKGEGVFSLSGRFSLNGGIEWLKIDVDGDEKWVCYGASWECPHGESGSQGHRAKSEQTTVKVGLRYVW